MGKEEGQAKGEGLSVLVSLVCCPGRKPGGRTGFSYLTAR